MSAVAIAKAIRAIGGTIDDVVKALEAHEAERKETRAERNRRYYENHKDKTIQTIKTPETSEQIKTSETSKSSESVLKDQAPRARVLCVEDSIIKNKTSNDVLQKGGNTKGTRITGCWSPETVDWHFAISELGEAADRELAKFRDYWIGRAGAGGVKLDWSATWRNWVRKAADDRKARAGPPRKVTPESLLRQSLGIGEFANVGGNDFQDNRTSGPIVEGLGYSSLGGS